MKQFQLGPEATRPFKEYEKALRNIAQEAAFDSSKLPEYRLANKSFCEMVEALGLPEIGEVFEG